MSEQQSTELALPVITEDKYPALYVSGGLDGYYQTIREQVMSEVPDLTTKKGIARVKSLAAMVSSSKVAVEKPGREYLKQLKEMPRVIEATLRDWNQKMDALRDEVRKPVTEMEEAEKARIAALDQRLNEIYQIGSVAGLDILPSETITAWIGKLEAISVDATWDEYQDRAALAKEAAKVKLEAFLQTRLTWEAQQAEIARLKAEQEEKDRIQREQQIAAQARHEAEQKAMREKLEAEQRERAAKDAQLKAEQDAYELQQKLEQERKDALLRQQQAVEQAAERERQRQIEEQNMIKYEAEQARIQEEIKAADIEHRKEIHNEVLSSLIEVAKAKGIDLSINVAKGIVSSIATGKIRHTSIKY
jgi:hypothetical protein